MIPFCRTTIGKEEKEAVNKVIDSGWVVMGEKTQEFEEMFAEYVGAKHAVFVDSCTNALLLACKYTWKEPLGSLIDVPSFTFTATAEAVVNSGNIPCFIDVDKDTFLMEDDGDFTQNNYRLPVHIAGRKSDLPALVYDSAHRIEKDEVEGDTLWCYSFYATKNLTSIQGGMIATNDTKAYEWLKKARDHGLDLDTQQRYQGKYMQYDIDFVGYRFKPSDLQAAVGIEQLKKLPQNNAKRDYIVDRYNEAFGLKRKGNHLYIITVKDQEKFKHFMMENDIQVVLHYRPLHTMTGWKKYAPVIGNKPLDLPNTEWLGEHCMSLPLYPDLTDGEVDFIIEKVKESGQLI